MATTTDVHVPNEGARSSHDRGAPRSDGDERGDGDADGGADEGAGHDALDRSSAVPRLKEAHLAIAGGIFAAAGVFGVAALVGQVSSFEARGLVGGLKPTATFAASTYIAAGATILALMATMISFSISHDTDFRRSHFRRLRLIARSTAVLIVVAIALLTCLGVPISQTEAPAAGYVALYWAILVLGAIGGGLLVTIVLTLNNVVRGLIELGSEGTSFLTVSDHDDADSCASG